MKSENCESTTKLCPCLFASPKNEQTVDMTAYTEENSIMCTMKWEVNLQETQKNKTAVRMT